MKLLISNQYGAIVMALLPFVYGMLLASPVWAHFFLLLAWFTMYLLSYPMLSLFKGKNMAEYKKWTIIYGVAAFLFALPAIFYNWQILFFIAAMFPFVLVSIYYTKKKDERNLLNDLAGIAIFALAGMGSYYFYPSLFFIGTTLYVKSMMRERKNPLYLKASIIFHVLCVLGCLFTQQYILSLAFVPALIRAIYLPTKKLSVKQVGLIEFGTSAIFLIILLIATL